MMKYLKLTLGAFALVCATPAMAGVISIVADAGITNTSVGLYADSCSSGSGSCTASSSLGESSWAAFSGVDVETGSLRASASITGEDSEHIDAYGSQAVAAARITETMKVLTAGSFTFNMAFDGFWDLSLEDDGAVAWSQAAVWYAETGITLYAKDGVGGPSYGNDVWRVGHSSPALGLTNSIDSSLSFTQYLEIGEYDFYSYVATTMINGVSGVIDFSNTAKIYVETADGDFEYETENFLTAPAYLDPSDPPSPVPEPSIIALFGLGLVGLGFARRRKT